MIRLSNLYANRKRNRKNYVPLTESKQCPYEVRFPELVDIAFNQIWGKLNGNQ